VPGGEVSGSLARLHAAHALVLDRAGEVRMALPFSNVETAYLVESDGRAWPANCAWDALAIPRLLGLERARLVDRGGAHRPGTSLTVTAGALPFGSEGRERAVGGAVPGAEDLQPVRDGAITEGELPPRGAEVARLRAEQLGEAGLRPPQRRSTQAGRRREVRGDHLNIWPTKPSGVQLARPIRPP
jgi:hypothetical protein